MSDVECADLLWWFVAPHAHTTTGSVTETIIHNCESYRICTPRLHMMEGEEDGQNRTNRRDWPAELRHPFTPVTLLPVRCRIRRE